MANLEGLSELEILEYQLSQANLAEDIAAKRVYELERAIYFARGFLEADGEAECLKALEDTGVLGCPVFDEGEDAEYARIEARKRPQWVFPKKKEKPALVYVKWEDLHSETDQASKRNRLRIPYPQEEEVLQFAAQHTKSLGMGLSAVTLKTLLEGNMELLEMFVYHLIQWQSSILCQQFKQDKDNEI